MNGVPAAHGQEDCIDEWYTLQYITLRQPMLPAVACRLNRRDGPRESALRYGLKQLRYRQPLTPARFTPTFVGALSQTWETLRYRQSMLPQYQTEAAHVDCYPNFRLLYRSLPLPLPLLLQLSRLPLLRSLEGRALKG